LTVRYIDLRFSAPSTATTSLLRRCSAKETAVAARPCQGVLAHQGERAQNPILAGRRLVIQSFRCFWHRPRIFSFLPPVESCLHNALLARRFPVCDGNCGLFPRFSQSTVEFAPRGKHLESIVQLHTLFYRKPYRPFGPKRFLLALSALSSP
jgi:hypothetical protein